MAMDGIPSRSGATSYDVAPVSPPSRTARWSRRVPRTRLNPDLSKEPMTPFYTHVIDCVQSEPITVLFICSLCLTLTE